MISSLRASNLRCSCVERLDLASSDVTMTIPLTTARSEFERRSSYTCIDLDSSLGNGSSVQFIRLSRAIWFSNPMTSLSRPAHACVPGRIVTPSIISRILLEICPVPMTPPTQRTLLREKCAASSNGTLRLSFSAQSKSQVQQLK